jgi:acyl-CoA dehydrogenase
VTESAAGAAAEEPDGELKLLAETCDALFGDHASDDDGDRPGWWNERLWAALERAGIPLISVPEPAGGSGGSLEQAAVVAISAGEHAARVPVAETALLGGWLLAQAGLPVPAGPLIAVRAPALAPASEADGISVTRGPDGWLVRGRLPRVGWGRVAARVVVLAESGGAELAVALSPGDVAVNPGSNVAGEPRDDLIVDTVADRAAVAEVAGGTGAALRLRAALARVLLISGAMGRALDLTVRYAAERQQFGRSLGSFQAVQQQIAELAAETAAVRAAADAAVRRCAADGFAGPGAWFTVASAKVQAARGATVAARVAHQVHGAIGFTQEHALRLTTTRLWAWRDEAGSPAQWAGELGRHVLAAGPLWPVITADAQRAGAQRQGGQHG